MLSKIRRGFSAGFRRKKGGFSGKKQKGIRRHCYSILLFPVIYFDHRTANNTPAAEKPDGTGKAGKKQKAGRNRKGRKETEGRAESERSETGNPEATKR